MKVKRVNAKGGSGTAGTLHQLQMSRIISRILELLELGKQAVGVHNVY